MPKYIWQREEWPSLTYDSAALLNPLAEAVKQQGLLTGLLESLVYRDLQNTKLDALTSEVLKSSEIEGDVLDYDAVRSAIAQRLGIKVGGVPGGDHRVEGAVEMAVDATENWKAPLTRERLLNWQAGLFPGGRGRSGPVRTGNWRDDSKGPMQVVSGRVDHLKVHFEAPPAQRMEADMRSFLKWFEFENATHGILKAGIAHLWFVTNHPFDDGNGRIGRAVLDLALARYDQREWRCYSVSSQMHQERKGYFDALEAAQKSSTDVTVWLAWYLGCLGRALQASAESVAGAVARGRFWQENADKELNERQRKVLQTMLVGGEAKMSNNRWQALANCTAQTAFRDLAELVVKGIFERDGAGGRGAGYVLLATQSLSQA